MLSLQNYHIETKLSYNKSVQHSSCDYYTGSSCVSLAIGSRAMCENSMFYR